MRTMRALIGTLALAGMIANGMMATPYAFRELSPDESTLVTGGLCAGMGSGVSVCGYSWCAIWGWNSNSGYAPFGGGNYEITNLPCPCNPNTGTMVIGPTGCGSGG